MMNELNENERLELRELRIDCQNITDRMKILEMELEDVQCEIRNLNDWKKGRATGFIISSCVFAIIIVVMFGYMKIQYESSITKGISLESAVSYSVSTTVLLTTLILMLAVMGLTIVLGIKVMIEVGNSSLSRKMARDNYKKNYYNEIERCEKEENDLRRALLEIRNSIRDKENRMKELEAREVPWNQ